MAGTSRFVDFNAGDNQWLYGTLWMGDHSFDGQLVVTHLDPETDTTRAYTLETPDNRSSGVMEPDLQVGTDIYLFSCKTTVRLSEKEIFQLENRSSSESKAVCRAPPDEGFSPGSLLANYTDTNNHHSVLSSGFGKDHFKFSDHTYASIDPVLFTPDEKHKYRGIWVGFYPGCGHQLLLFHQESENRLEVIKLTGDQYVPRGTHSMIVNDLSETTRLCSDAEWQDAPIVAAQIQGAEEKLSETFWMSVELVLVSNNEIVVLEDSIGMQFKRLSTELLLSDGTLTFPDCCSCDSFVHPSIPSATGTADGKYSRDSLYKSQPRAVSPYSKLSIVGDAEFLGLGRHRAPLLSVFQSPLGNTTQPSIEAIHMDCSMHKLCRCCTSFFASVALERDPNAELLPPHSQHRLHQSLSRLKMAVRDGCHFCSLVLYNLDRLDMLASKDRNSPDNGIYLFYSCFQGRGRERVTWDHEKNKPPPPFESTTVYASLHPTGQQLDTFIKPGVVPEGYIKFSPATSDENESHPSLVPDSSAANFTTQSSKHMRLAQNWLEQCVQGHRQCNLGDPAFTPSRLLYVGSTSLHLHLTKGDPSPKTYCCLSHCWGGVTDIPLLKKNTVAQFIAGIDIKTLPRSFQDAVLITRQLGIDYVWIDSLCIIQDSTDDWAAEAAVMGKVYENGHCTISLAEAKTPHEGAFVYRDPRTCHSVRIASLPQGELLLQPPMPVGRESSLNIRMSPFVVWAAKLLSRGWVFQEALLSPRILYFGRGLFWTCRCGQASELDPTGRGVTTPGIVYGAIEDAIFRPIDKSGKPGETSGKDGDAKNQTAQSELLDMFYRGQPVGGNAPGRAEYEALLSAAASRNPVDYTVHIQWMRLLGSYTKLQLTVAKDRLPALGGIAQNIQRPQGWRYLAGLWEPSLLFDLVWTTATYERGLAPRPADACAPTWSWASVDAIVGTNLNTMSEYMRKEAVFLARVVSVATKGHPADVSGTGEVYSGELVIEGVLIDVICAAKENFLDNFPLTDSEGRDIGEMAPDIKPVGVEGKQMHVLPIVRVPENSYGAKAGDVTVHGIGLVHKGGYFERVGYCSFTYTPETGLFSKYAKAKREILIK